VQNKTLFIPQLLEARKSQLQQQQMTSTQEVKSWKERVEQESATVEGLQCALDDKEQQLKRTVQSLNEVSATSLLIELVLLPTNSTVSERGYTSL